MYHRIIIAGYLGRDPEMRYTASGKAVTNFSVASSRTWTDQDGSKRDETVWFRVSVWGRQAETTNQYLAKGRAVLVEGRMRPDENGNPRIWTGQDGQARASFEVVAQTVRFLGRRDEGAPSDVPELAEEPEIGAEEEIPF
jgi:single-strand DNA-binding protein